ncbi:MAG: hypothetical protein U5K30_01800 [Acidimicrobiales bacterium]|nr:hypothetical protein [Acidimicrobiales bacterium]
MGDNTIHYTGHVKMMAAVQPFISGAISKTVNMPEEATVADVEQLHIDAWQMGVKAIAIYRDNCKVVPAAVDGEGRHAGEVVADPSGGRRGRGEGRREGRSTSRRGEAAPQPRPRGPSSSGWPTARASSPSASTTTAVRARSS